MHDPASLPALAPIATLIVLLEVAVGTTAAAYAVDLLGRIGRGFAGTTALICAALTGVEVLLSALLPGTTTLFGAPPPAGSLASLVHWSIALAVALLAYAFFCAVGTDAARRVVGLATLAIGAMAIAKSAAAFGPALGGVLVAAVAFVPATLVSGSALAGMLLGHWYLVATNLSFRPLRRAVDIVLLSVGAQACVIVAAVATATTVARDQLIRADYAVPFWLLVVGSGIVFTAAIAVLTRHFARIRANQPATAMLYVLIISVVMGVVPAHLLFFLTGVPV